MGVWVIDAQVEPDRQLADAAARWIVSAHFDVAVEVLGDRIILTSTDRADEELRLLWTAGLLNERLLADAGNRRLLILNELVQ